MSSIIKVTLLLAVVVCISVAQFDGQLCLCQRFRNQLPPKSEVKDIQIYPPTEFCAKVEIIVTANNGVRFCLNPKLKGTKKILANIIRKKTSSTTVQTTLLTSTPVSTAQTPSHDYSD